jgi:hypothetical protein
VGTRHILFVTHDVDESVYVGDRVVVLGRFAECGLAARFGDRHVRRTQQVSGTVPDHGRLGPFHREGAQDTSPPDEAGGHKYETERYEQESVRVVRHLSSLHHLRGDRHARTGVMLPIFGATWCQ